jgi:hypothetical protein
MIRHIHNWPELVAAINEMNEVKYPREGRVIVFHDTGEQTYRFVISDHGLSKLPSDKRGNELYPEVLR